MREWQGSHIHWSRSSNGILDVRKARHFKNSEKTIWPSLFLSNIENILSKKNPSFKPTNTRNSLKIIDWAKMTTAHRSLHHPRANYLSAWIHHKESRFHLQKLHFTDWKKSIQFVASCSSFSSFGLILYLACVFPMAITNKWKDNKMSQNVTTSYNILQKDLLYTKRNITLVIRL